MPASAAVAVHSNIRCLEKLGEGACMSQACRRAVPSCGPQSRRREAERQERAARAAAYQEAAWVDQAGASASSEASEASDEGGAAEAAAVAGELYCLACDKLFRSANALANHERCALLHVSALNPKTLPGLRQAAPRRQRSRQPPAVCASGFRPESLKDRVAVWICARWDSRTL